MSPASGRMQRRRRGRPDERQPLTPFMPSVCAELLQKLGLEAGDDGQHPDLAGARIAAGAPLFPMDPVAP